MNKYKYLVFQITSRRNFDVGEILFKNNNLSKIITDFYFFSTNYLDKFILLIYQSFRKYKNKEIEDKFIIRSIFSGLIYRFYIKFFSKKYFNKGLTLSSKILLLKLNKLKFNTFSHIYAFDTGAKEIFEEYHLSKVLILEQCVAPRVSQLKMYQDLSLNYNLNFNEYIENCKNYIYNESIELSLASKIICPSEYVMKELQNQGVDKDKISIVPYGYTNPYNNSLIKDKIKERLENKILHILFVGNEAVRKGVLDIINVSNHFLSQNVKFHLVGDILSELKRFKVNEFPENIILHGKLNKKDLHDLYLKSSLFFLPSYLEGSALVNYEALSFGIPLLTTFESGSVIENNKEGFIVERGDITSMIDKIKFYINNKDVRKKMSFNSLDLSVNYTLEKYKKRLLKNI